MTLSGRTHQGSKVAAANGKGPLPGPVSEIPAQLSVDEQTTLIRELRRNAVVSYREVFRTSASPIRLMARMVREVVEQARAAGISSDVIKREIENRTIGDVNVRLITEVIDGVDYSTIGEDLGLILPGETIGGRISDGRVHNELKRREDEIERRLLDEFGWDMRIYDVYGIGNPLLRRLLAERFERSWGLHTDPEQTFASIGALDSLYKTILALGYNFKVKYGVVPSFGFPAPGFAVVNWQVQMFGLNLIKLHTTRESNFKLTYGELRDALAANPDLRFLYFTVSNNPTAFSYSPDEIRDVYRALQEDGREIAVLADLAYVGTGVEADDRSRMAAFNTPFALANTIFINSLSKVFTLTGDRCGWASLQNKEWSELMRAAWNNTTAGLPAQWQLRFTASVQWFDEHPEIQVKIKRLYDLRREHFRAQLEDRNANVALFDEIGLDDHATIYNWSRLKPGEDALSLFEKTGIAGVSGSAFGYSDEYIRFSVGFTPIS